MPQTGHMTLRGVQCGQPSTIYSNNCVRIRFLIEFVSDSRG